MVDIIAGLFVLACLSFACGYIYKEKKAGAKCIGCPLAKNCTKHKCQG